MTAARTLLALAAICCAVAVLVLVTGGFSFELGGRLIRSHNAWRPFVLAAALTMLALATGRRTAVDALAWWWDAIERRAWAAAAAIAAAAVAIGLAWGTFVAGGSDSYCYLNQAELFARGDVADAEPLSADPAWPGNPWSFVPAGHMPLGAGDTLRLVPICPPGYPLMLAAARVTFGRIAMFWVTPLMGGLAVWLVYLLGSRLAGPGAGLLGAVLAAASPTLLFQIVQPMNDVPAAAMWCAALVAAGHPRWTETRRALAGGALTGLALSIRPNLLPLAGIVAFGAAAIADDRPLGARVRVLILFGLAAIPGGAVVLLLQHAMYGSPFKSGYGDLSLLFSSTNVLPNLQRYPRWLIETHTVLIAAALGAPLVLQTREARRQATWLLAFAAATLLCYLPYVVFDAWWYTRFLLPAILPVLAMTAAAVVTIVRRLPHAARAPVFCAVVFACALIEVSTAVRRDAFRMRDLEWRYRSAGEFVATLPANAALITVHQSGSVRFYARRSALLWADIEPARLGDALAVLRRHGRKPYLLFEGWEEPAFKQRFAGHPLASLDWPPIATVDGVNIYDPDDRDRHARGETIQTRRIVTDRR